MSNETNRWLRIGLAVGAIAVAAGLYVEFASPSLRSSDRLRFGDQYGPRLELVTTRSPILGRVVGREANVTGLNGTRLGSCDQVVFEELWRHANQMAKINEVSWAHGLPESRYLYMMLSHIAMKTGDAELSRFLEKNRPI